MGREPSDDIGYRADGCHIAVQRNLGHSQILTGQRLTMDDRAGDYDGRGPLVVTVEEQQAAQTTTYDEQRGKQSLRDLGS
jgi:hypothetical protein